MEEVIAKSNGVRVSPRKVRLVADAVRNLEIEDALSSLSTLRKRGGYVLEKTLRSAIANATSNSGLKRESLRIKSIEVGESAFLKRFRPSTRGRVHPYKRRGTNVRIILEGEKANGS